MMIRLLYITLIRLHPPAFRERFGPEMIGIFDEDAGRTRGALLVDALISLLRQRMLRRPQRAPVALPVAAPLMFQTIEEGLPRRSALFQGALLSVFFFVAVTSDIGHRRSFPRLLIGAKYPRPHVLPAKRSSVAEAEATTEVKVPLPQTDLNQFAKAYFQALAVLRVLDADRDLILSTSEIITAPAVLPKLDKNHDGTLDAEECGFSAGRRPSTESLLNHARFEFMRRNPVLAALDADGNGELSVAEIKTSSMALRSLDSNQDGALTAGEVMRRPGTPRRE